MRILLLKSLLLCTNCPSFPPILCGILLFLPWIPFCFCRGIVSAMDSFCFYRGILFVFAVDSFVYIPSSFLFLPWIPLFLFLLPFCFCRGFVSAVDVFLYIPSFFLFFSFLPCSFNFLPRNPKNVGVFLEKVHRFSEKVHRFWGLLPNV